MDFLDFVDGTELVRRTADDSIDLLRVHIGYAAKSLHDPEPALPDPPKAVSPFHDKGNATLADFFRNTKDTSRFRKRLTCW